MVTGQSHFGGLQMSFALGMTKLREAFNFFAVFRMLTNSKLHLI